MATGTIDKPLNVEVEDLQLAGITAITEDLTSHTTVANAYVIPADGYVAVYNNDTSHNGFLYILGSNTDVNNAYLQIGAQPGRYTTFVRKGMRVYISGSVNTARYVRLW